MVSVVLSDDLKGDSGVMPKKEEGEGEWLWVGLLRAIYRQFSSR